MIRFFPCVLSLLLFFAAGTSRAATIQPASKDEQLKVAMQVRDIFFASCLDCHGPELPRPKGKFGYVLDLKRMADNPDYVVRGNPDESEMYKMIKNDEMPGEDANVPQLTPEQKDIVKRWVEIGAPHELPAGALEKEPVPASSAEAPAASMPVGKRAFRLIGKFHPVSTHFPVALMMVAVLAESLAWWTRRDSWLQTVRFLVIVGALGAVSAAVLGWINASFQNYVGQGATTLLWHRWLGTFAALWCVLCASLVVLSECREGSPERQRFRGTLLVGAALIGAAGFLGSALIYGLDHYSW